MTRELHIAKANETSEMLGYSIDNDGQFYSLDMLNEIDEAAEQYRLNLLTAQQNTEHKMQQSQDSTDAEKNALVAEHWYFSDKLNKLTGFCISRGLYEEESEATAA